MIVVSVLKKSFYTLSIFIFALFPLYSAHISQSHAQVDLDDIRNAATECGLGAVGRAIGTALGNQLGNLASGVFSSVTDIDTSKVPVQDIDTNNKLDTANQLYEIKEFVEDCLVRRAAQLASEQITYATIQWVNTGLDGQPFYVRNLANHYAGLANGIAQQYIFELSTELENDEYTPYVVQSLAKSQSNPTLAEKLGCPDDRKMSAVFEGGESDSWFAFMGAVSTPGCTTQGRILAAQNDIQMRQSNALEREEQQLAWSGGVISERDEEGNVVTPGVVITELLNKTLGTGQDQLIQTDEFSELYVSLVNQAFTIMSGGGSLFET